MATSSNSPIKIVHVLHSFDVGGLENGVVNLINSLDWDRYVHVLCCITIAGRMTQRLKRHDVEIIELKKKPGPNWTLPYRLGRLFRKLRPEIVHTRNWGTVDGILGARLGGVPIVVHGEHGRTILEVESRSRKRRLIRCTLSPLVNQFVAVSRELRDWVRTANGIRAGKIQVIYNGVDVNKFCGTHNKPAAKEEAGLDSTDFVFGTIGRLDPVKNQALLIKALPSLLRHFPNVKLIIVGTGACVQQLEDLIRQFDLSESTILVGESDDIPSLLKSLDVFVLPSISEGISNTILEAMACGLPVIATDVGGNGELVVSNETGLLVQANDVNSIREAMRLYVERPTQCEAHGTAGRRRAEEVFPLEKMVKTYDDMYCCLAGRLNKNSPLLTNIDFP